jgi:hypothetical protein
VIVLEPSLSVKRCFSQIDFDVLSAAITSVLIMVFGYQHNKVIKIHKSRDPKADYYCFFDGKIYMILDPKRRETNIIRTIVHEIRHYLQEKVFKKDIHCKALYDDSTSSKYWKSPLEVDARNFDTLLSKEVREVYRKLKRVKAMSQKNELDQFHTSCSTT